MDPETVKKTRGHYLRDSRLLHAMWLTVKKHNASVACRASASALAPSSPILFPLQGTRLSMVPFAL